MALCDLLGESFMLLRDMLHCKSHCRIIIGKVLRIFFTYFHDNKLTLNENEQHKQGAVVCLHDQSRSSLERALFFD